MEKKHIILPEKKHERALPEDLSIRINLEETKNLLTNDDRDVTLDLNALFNRERNESIKYKIFGKIKMVFRNMYYSTVVSPYQYLAERIYPLDDGSDGDFNGYLPYNEFAFLRNDAYRKIINRDNEPYDSLSNFDGFTTKLTGSTDHTVITTINAPYYNWNVYLSYANGTNNQYPMTYTLSGNTDPLVFTSGDGIPFRVEDNGGEYKLTSPVPHGMTEGEYIIIKDPDNLTTLRLYGINSTGDEVYRSENYVINISKTQVKSDDETFLNPIITGKRCLDRKNIDKTTSQYYVHQLKTLTSEDGCTVDKVGFESPIWKDEKKVLYKDINGTPNVIVEKNRMESILYDFNEPIILSGITNNLGYTPTEFYTSIIFRNGNGYFDYPPKVGYSFNFHETWIDKHFDGGNSKEPSITAEQFQRTSGGISYQFTSGNTIPIGTILIGNFIEYNPMELKERVISAPYHKIIINPIIFNHGQTGSTATFSGVTVSNPFGLFYQPHYKVKLRELSPDVEISKETVIDNLPQNAKYYEDEKNWKWRDLYDHGYIDTDGNGTNYPFLNNTHYVKTDINFYLKNEETYTPKTDGINDFENSGLIFC